MSRGPDAVGVSDVRHSYAATRGSPDRRALDGVSLNVAEGEFVAILGPNGSGKSTLLAIMATAMSPSSGTVAWWPSAERAGRTVRARLGVVFQSPGLDELLTVRENLRTAAALHGLARVEADRRIAGVAGRMELTDRLDQRCGTLSGGLRRRADLARAVLHEPDLLLLDEPGTGLDLRSRRGFLGLIDSLRRERTESAGRPPLTVVMSTHLMDEAEAADRAVLMHEGRIVADDTPGNLRDRVGPAVVRVELRDEQMPEEIRGLLSGTGVKTTPVKDQGAEDGSADRAIAMHGWTSFVLPNDPTERQRLVASLIDRGIAFEYGKPTLADAYLALTGSTLTTEDRVPLPSSRGRRRLRTSREASA